MPYWDYNLRTLLGFHQYILEIGGGANVKPWEIALLLPSPLTSPNRVCSSGSSALKTQASNALKMTGRSFKHWPQDGITQSMPDCICIKSGVRPFLSQRVPSNSIIWEVTSLHYTLSSTNQGKTVPKSGNIVQFQIQKCGKHQSKPSVLTRDDRHRHLCPKTFGKVMRMKMSINAGFYECSYACDIQWMWLEIKDKIRFCISFSKSELYFFNVEGAKFALDTFESVAIYRNISGNCHRAFAQQKYLGSLPLLPVQILGPAILHIAQHQAH